MIKEFSVQVNHLTFAIKQWGQDDAPPILALHGWLDNAATFERLAPLLQGYRVLALDFAGHGLSDHRPKGTRYHLMDNLDDVIGVADQLNLQQFILMGHSMGAGVSTLLAASIPNRISKLILIEGVGTQTHPAEKAAELCAEAVADSYAVNPQTFSQFPSREIAVQARTTSFGGISLAAATSLGSRGISIKGGEFYWHADPQLKAKSLFRLTEQMTASFLQRIVMPALVVLGNDSYFVAWKELGERAEQLARGSVVRLPGNHHLHLEPDTVSAVAKEVNQFLAAN